MFLSAPRQSILEGRLSILGPAEMPSNPFWSLLSHVFWFSFDFMFGFNNLSIIVWNLPRLTYATHHSFTNIILKNCCVYSTSTYLEKSCSGFSTRQDLVTWVPPLIWCIVPFSPGFFWFYRTSNIVSFSMRNFQEYRCASNRLSCNIHRASWT